MNVYSFLILFYFIFFFLEEEIHSVSVIRMVFQLTSKLCVVVGRSNERSFIVFEFIDDIHIVASPFGKVLNCHCLILPFFFFLIVLYMFVLSLSIGFLKKIKKNYFKKSKKSCRKVLTFSRRFSIIITEREKRRQENESQ